jgi:Fe-S-cluster containining protein
MGSILCEHCTGLCCQYIALPIDKPTTRRDFDDIRWYVMHENISVFVEDGEWFIQIAARCENLQPDNMCGIYEHRPGICREYDAGECDYEGGDYHYEVYFKTAQDVEEYAVKKLGKRAAFTNGRKPKAPPANAKATIKRLRVIGKR